MCRGTRQGAGKIAWLGWRFRASWGGHRRTYRCFSVMLSMKGTSCQSFCLSCDRKGLQAAPPDVQLQGWYNKLRQRRMMQAVETRQEQSASKGRQPNPAPTHLPLLLPSVVPSAVIQSPRRT